MGEEIVKFCAAVILVLGIFVFGVYMGGSAGVSSAAKDCATLGKFRDGSTVYECSPMGKDDKHGG
jgi:hypothetical protein